MVATALMTGTYGRPTVAAKAVDTHGSGEFKVSDLDATNHNRHR